MGFSVRPSPLAPRDFTRSLINGEEEAREGVAPIV